MRLAESVNSDNNLNIQAHQILYRHTILWAYLLKVWKISYFVLKRRDQFYGKHLQD